MTQVEILKLAYEGALARWYDESKHLAKNPTNKVSKDREANAYSTLNQIRAMLVQAETDEVQR